MSVLATRVSTARVSSRPVGLLRIGVGIAAILGAVESTATMTMLTHPGFASFPYSPLSWEWSSSYVAPIGLAWLLLAVAFAIGCVTRLAGFDLAAVIGLVIQSDQQLYSNHLVLLALVVLFLTLSNCGAACSVDSSRGRGTRSVPAWPLLLLKMQLTTVYFFAALAKINGEYLSGNVLHRILRTGGEVVASAETPRPPTVFAILAVASIITEFGLAAAMWSTHVRRFGLATAALFHTSILLVMGNSVLMIVNLGVFGIESVGMYALFCSVPVTFGIFSPAMDAEDVNEKRSPGLQPSEVVSDSAGRFAA